METNFIYERLRTPVGIKTEHISGSEQRQGKLWRLMALQVYAENGRDSYRSVDHISCGAPVLDGEPTRISLTHTGHLLVVATIPEVQGADLEHFDPRTALGVDAEDLGREQVFRVRDRFLCREELELIPADDLQANVLAWTVKEAVWKAMLTPGLDFQNSIIIKELPELGKTPGPGVPAPRLGHAVVRTDEGEIPFSLYAYTYGPYAVTLAFTAQTATFAPSKAK